MITCSIYKKRNPLLIIKKKIVDLKNKCNLLI